MQYQSDIESTRMPREGETIAEYFFSVFDELGTVKLTDTARTMLCDTQCGADCVRIIKNAGDMVQAVEAGIGDCGEYDRLRRVTTRVLNAFIDG